MEMSKVEAMVLTCGAVRGNEDIVKAFRANKSLWSFYRGSWRYKKPLGECGNIIIGPTMWDRGQDFEHFEAPKEGPSFFRVQAADWTT